MSRALDKEKIFNPRWIDKAKGYRQIKTLDRLVQNKEFCYHVTKVERDFRVFENTLRLRSEIS